MFERPAAIEEAFADAWAQLQAGRNMADVLAAYPEFAAELEPLLRLSLSLRNAPRPALSPAALGRIHTRAQAAAAARADRPWQRLWWPGLRAGLAVLGLFLLMITAMLASRAGILPGGPSATPTPVLLTYTGTIDSLSPTIWQIGNIQVIIDAATEIHGQPTVGSVVRCVGERMPLPGYRFRAYRVWVLAGTPTPLTPVNPGFYSH
jgi:hypothetical protein